MQTADTPLACTLPSDALQKRLMWIRKVTSESLTAHRLEGATLHLTYRRQAGSALARIVAEEQQCCAFLRFSMRDLPDGIELEIQAPESAGSGARWLFDHFLPTAQQVAGPKACGCLPGTCT